MKDVLTQNMYNFDVAGLFFYQFKIKWIGDELTAGIGMLLFFFFWIVARLKRYSCRVTIHCNLGHSPLIFYQFAPS